MKLELKEAVYLKRMLKNRRNLLLNKRKKLEGSKVDQRKKLDNELITEIQEVSQIIYKVNEERQRYMDKESKTMSKIGNVKNINSYV